MSCKQRQNQNSSKEGKYVSFAQTFIMTFHYCTLSWTTESFIFWTVLIDWWSLREHYSPLSWADSLCSHVILHEWLAFYSMFLEYPPKWCSYVLAWLVPHETAAILVQVLCTPYNHTPYHFMQSHICKVYVCLAVTCRMTRICYVLMR